MGRGGGISSDFRSPCLTASSGPRADHAGTSWRSWTSSWFQDCRILSLCCRRMMPRWPNIAQDSIKMSKQWLREGPTRPSSMPKSFQNAVLSFVFSVCRFFHKIASTIQKSDPGVPQKLHLDLQVGHLGHILAPRSPT